MAILLVSGSPRPAGQTILAVRALASALEARGYDAAILDLAQEDLPPFRGEPVGPVGEGWRARVRAAEAVVLASPEYHGGMSGAIKTFLDYLTFEEIRDRPFGLVGVSSGRSGGVRAVLQMQDVVVALWGRVVGPAVQVPEIKTAFDADGAFADPLVQRLQGLFLDRLQASVPPPAASGGSPL